MDLFKCKHRVVTPQLHAHSQTTLPTTALPGTDCLTHSQQMNGIPNMFRQRLQVEKLLHSACCRIVAAYLAVVWPVFVSATRCHRLVITGVTCIHIFHMVRLNARDGMTNCSLFKTF
jgi:hypothetical protein